MPKVVPKSSVATLSWSRHRVLTLVRHGQTSRHVGVWVPIISLIRFKDV